MHKLLKLHSFVMISLFTLILNSCGFVEDEPLKDTRLLQTDELSSGCKIDPDKIKNVFDEVIDSEIECIETQLERFKYVRTQSPDTLTEADIKRFIEKYLPENKEAVIDGLSLMFKLNTLLLRDAPGQMKRENISPFFELLKILNRRAVVMFDKIELMRKADADDIETFKKYRKSLNNELNLFAKEMISVMNSVKGEAQSIDLENFIYELTKELEDFEDLNDLISSLLFVKKLFLGGERNFINSDEVLKLFEVFPSLGINAFDLFLQKEDFFPSKGEYYEHIANNIESLISNVFAHQEEEIILTLNDINKIIDEFLDDESDENPFVQFFGSTNALASQELKDIVKSLKKHIIGGKDVEVFNYKDVEVTTALAIIAIRTLENVNKLTELVKDIDERTPEERINIKVDFIKIFNKLSKRAIELISATQDLPREMKILSFIQELPDDILDLKDEVITSGFSVKVAITGGSRETLTLEELLAILKKSNSIATLFYDFSFLAEDYFERSTKQKYNFLAAEVTTLRSIISKRNDLTNILSLDDIRVLLGVFYDETDPEDKKRIEALINVADNFFKNILDIEKDNIDINELKTSIDMALVALRGLEFVGYHEELKEQMSRGDVPNAKQLFDKEFAKISLALKTALDRDIFLDKPVDLYSFIDRLKEAKEIIDINTDLFLKALHFKNLLLGGDNYKLSRNELKFLNSKLANYGDIVFDITIKDLENLEPTIELYKVFLNVLNNLEDSVFKYPATGAPITHFKVTQALSFAKELIIEIDRNSEDEEDDEDDSELIDPTKFKRTIVDVVEGILLGIPAESRTYPDACSYYSTKDCYQKCVEIDPERWDQDHDGIPDFKGDVDYRQREFDANFTNIAFNALMKMLRESVQALIFADATYTHFEDYLALPRKIPTGEFREFPRLPEYELIDHGHFEYLKGSFKKVAAEFKYFRDDSNYPKYFNEVRRKREGYVSIVLMRYLLRSIVKTYGDPGADPDTTEGFSNLQVNNFLVGIKSVLQELDLWTKNYKTFGTNILLLADLFQNASDGNSKVSLNEATEFIELLTTAAGMSQELMTYLKLKCPSSYNEDDDSVESECVRRNFMSAMFDRLDEFPDHPDIGKYADLKEYFPRLYEYQKNAGAEDSEAYIKGVEIFARDVPIADMTKTPWKLGDFALVLGAMLNIESTFMRFDSVYDNSLNFNELFTAFKDVYEGGIITIAELEETPQFAKTVFFYLIKYGTTPATDIGGKLVIFTHDLFFKRIYKDTIASRKSIGTLLKNIKELNEATLNEDPPSQCELPDSLTEAYRSTPVEATKEGFFKTAWKVRKELIDNIGLTFDEVFDVLKDQKDQFFNLFK